jgi:hypothetical protein
VTEETAQGQIDWGAAEVRGGVLEVPLAGEPPKAWTARLEEVLERLASEGHSGPWESVDVTRKALKVHGVQPGGEGDVHYVLDAAVTQANADLAPDPQDEPDDGASDDDRSMTDAFRAFAADDD